MSEKNEINKKEFEKDYYSMTNDKLAQKYCISTVTVWNIAKELGLSKGNKKIKLV